MNDADAMSLCDRLAHLQQELDCLLDGERPPLTEPLREISPFEILHHHVRSAVVEGPHVGDASHVLALYLHRRARFSSEPRDGLAIGEGLRQQELDCDAVIELLVACGDDHAHAARTEDLLDAVFAGEQISLSNSGDELRVIVHALVFTDARAARAPFDSQGRSESMVIAA